MRKLVLGLVIGLVAGLGTVAVAQTTVTSADFCVKDNGKLRLAIDGSCAVDEQLLTIAGETGPPGADGQDGVDGTDGVDGVDGQNGIDGLDGVAGYEIVTQVGEWGGGGGRRELTVSCRPGKRALGSGYHGGTYGGPAGSSDEFQINALLYETRPINGGTAWAFTWIGDFTGGVSSYEHYVICADV